MRLRKTRLHSLVVTLGVAISACGRGQDTPSLESSTQAGAVARKVDTTTAGTITGSAILVGPAPANELIRMNADPVCVREGKGPQQQETFVVGSAGTLANVFVYVKGGLGNYLYDAPTQPATLDQRDCRYTPHVFGVRVGQPIEIINSDPTLHNIHAVPKANQEFNTGQPIQGIKMTHAFTAAEVMVPFKCDVHGWMNAYVGILQHPYFSVTGTDGKFELKPLPPGTYTVEAWHERLGTMTESVTLGQTETKSVMFHFKAPAATTD